MAKLVEQDGMLVFEGKWETVSTRLAEQARGDRKQAAEDAVGIGVGVVTAAAIAGVGWVVISAVRWLAHHPLFGG